MGNQLFFALILLVIVIAAEKAVKVRLERRPEASSGMPLKNINLAEYYGRVQYGTPQKSFDVVFDTSLKWTWIPTGECYECHYCPRYYPSESSSWKDLHKDVFFPYSTGDREGVIKGRLYQDTLSVNRMTVTEQHFLGVFDEGNIFPYLHSSGFIGLSPEKDEKNWNFMDNLKRLNLIEKEMFSIRLSSIPNDVSSEIMFGDYNRDLVEGELHYVKNFGKDKWLINMQEMKFGNIRIPLHHPHAELSTSERHLRMVRTDFAIVEEYLRNKYTCFFDTNYLFYCSVDKADYNDFPLIKFKLDTFTMYIHPEDYIVFSNDPESGKYLATFLIEVYPNHVIPYTLIGTLGLRNYYVVYDIGNNQVGFSSIRLPPGASKTAIVLGIVLPLLFIGLLAGGYLIYRKKRYGQFCGKTSQLLASQKSPMLP